MGGSQDDRPSAPDSRSGFPHRSSFSLADRIASHKRTGSRGDTGKATAGGSADDASEVVAKRSRISKPDHIKHRRTRTGCYTCRNRRVKCDEQRPTCERCAKGKRECTYPEARPNSKSSSSTNVKKEQPDTTRDDSRSPSVEDDGLEATSSAALELSDRPTPPRHQSDSASSTSLSGRRSSRVPFTSPFARTRKSDANANFDPSLSPSTDTSSIPASAGLEAPLRFSSFSTNASPGQLSWNHLPEDLQFYLEYHQRHLTIHHYFFKHDAEHFLHGILFDQALQYEPLLYALVGFAAYHMTVRRPDGKIQDFLGYYDRAVSSLRKSLAGRQAHASATLLTILQLATFEVSLIPYSSEGFAWVKNVDHEQEFLGDYVSLLSHQQAACRMLSELYSPSTIMESELSRKIFAWYARFDLTGGLMSENETTLSREWFVAAKEYYQQQENVTPENLDTKMELVIASYRLLCAELASLFSTFGTATKERIEADSRPYKLALENWPHDLDPVFRDEQHLVHSFDGRMKDPADIVDPYQPGGLWKEPLYTFNFMKLDWLAILMMFKYKMASILGQPPPSELPRLALEACRLFETIEYWPSSPAGSVVRAQACLGIVSLFLPKDKRHTMWCRTKLARIESLGHIYPSAFRERMASLWGIPEIRHWWLPRDESYPQVVRSIRFCMEDRLPTASNQTRSEDQRNIKSIFAHLSVADDSGPASRRAAYDPPSRWTVPNHEPRGFQLPVEDDDGDDEHAQLSPLDESRRRFTQMMQDRDQGRGSW